MAQYSVKTSGGESYPVSKERFVRLMFERAEQSLKSIGALAERESWGDACFWSCTAAGQALASYLVYAGGERGELESAGALAQRCAEFEPAFSQVVRPGKYLDRYYAITRDPDALPAGAVAWEWFDAADGAEAAQFAAEIVEFTRRRLPPSVHKAAG